MSSSEKPTYFLSDVHFGPNDMAKCEKLESLLELIAREEAKCYILGDLFDFWFEFFGGIPTGYNEPLKLLKNATSAGLEITVTGGNHDFWLGNKFEMLSGCKAIRRPFVGAIGGRTIYAGHGDGLAPSDWGYRLILKPILRCPLNIFLFKLFPRSIGERLARSASNSSRLYTKRRNLKFESEYISAAKKIAKSGIELVIVGHTHEPARIVKLEDFTYVNLGDFFEQYSYAVLKKGEITLHNL